MDNAIAIPQNVDLNNYNQFGNYVSSSASITNTLKNCPLTGSGFVLHVERITGAKETFCKQRIIVNNFDSKEYWRVQNENAWHTWYLMQGTEVT